MKKLLNLVLIVIAIALAAIALRLYLLEASLKGFQDSAGSIIGSNQALANSNARLEAEIVNLKKEISAIRESLSKK